MSLIDIHAHWMPQSYVAAMDGIATNGNNHVGFLRWDEAQHLATMDRHDIAGSLLSIPMPGLSLLAAPKARDLARRLNEEAALLRERTNGRLAAFAVLPLPDLDGALQEIEYALDVLKLDGVSLFTNIEGVFLGDAFYDPVLDEADRRGTVVFTHPTTPPGHHHGAPGSDGLSLTDAYGTTRMILNLVASGTLQRFTEMKVIASHGSGAAPFLGWLISDFVTSGFQTSRRMSADEVTSQIKAIYYETMAIPSSGSLSNYRNFVPSSRRLFGTSFPISSQDKIALHLSALRSPDAGFSASDIDALESGNARSLFPRLSGLIGAGATQVARSAVRLWD